MFSKIKAGFQKAGKGMKDGLEKAGHNVKGGLEKAGHTIKEKVDEANRSLSESRSHHASPQKKKSSLKSSAASTHDKDEKAHTTTASEKKSDRASTLQTAAPSSGRESHHSATRASSVHSEKSSRDSVQEVETTPAEAPAAPRSRAGTPAPPPPPRVPKRASEKAPTEIASPAATPAVEEQPPKLGRTPSVESTGNNSPRDSEAEEMETPGSIQFTVEPESALQESASPKTETAAASADVVPALKKTTSKAAEAMKGGAALDDKTDDLTTESSLDIEVEEEEGTPLKADAAADNVTEKLEEAKRAAKEKAAAKPSTRTAARSKSATPREMEAEVPASKGLKTRSGLKAPSSKGSTKTSEEEEDEGGAEDTTVKGRPGKSGRSARSTPQPSHQGSSSSSSVSHSTSAKERAKRTTSLRESRNGVTFAEDTLEAPREKKKETSKEPKRQHKARSLAAHRKERSSDDEKERSTDDEAETGGKSVAAAADASFSHRHRSRSSSRIGDDGDNADGVDAAREVRPRRQNRGFRLSLAKDSDNNCEAMAEDSDGGAGRRRRTGRASPERAHRSTVKPPSRDASREKRRELSLHRNGERYEQTDSPLRRTAAAAAAARRDERNDLSSRHYSRRRREGRGDAMSPATPPRVRRRGSTQRTPLRTMDGGMLVEEVLRDTEERGNDYLRGPVRRRNSSRGRRYSGGADDDVDLAANGHAHHDGGTTQRRSAVRSTYQLDYPDWSQHAQDGAPPLSLGGWQRMSPTRSRGPTSPASFHRLSFYDEDDALAADAVSEPDRFRAYSAARRHSRNGRRLNSAYGSGGEEAMPHRVVSRSPSSAGSVDERWGGASDDGRGGWHLRQRAYSVASRDATPPYAAYHNGERRATPVSERHRYDAPRPWSSDRTSAAASPCTSQRRRRSSSTIDRGADGSRRGAESWHVLEEDRVDPDYYFSDAPRERSERDGGGGGSWRSRRRASAFAPSPPRSPLWAHRSSFGRSAQEVSPNLHRLQRSYGGGDGGVVSALTTTLSPLRGRRASSASRCNAAHSTAAGTANSSVLRTSPSRHASVRSEEEILDEVEWKLDLLGQQIAEEDESRERAMRSSPFERLYHLNNRRDRDERRRKVFQLNRLERIRDRIVSGSLEEDIARREERLRKQEEMLTSPNGVFLRLYQNTSGRKSKTVRQSTLEEGSRPSTPQQSGAGAGLGSLNATGLSKASSRPGSATRRTLSREQRLAMCDRLYGGALERKGRKEEQIKQTAEERRQREVEELLIARLIGQLQLQQARVQPRDKKPPLTLAELEQQARRELEKLRQEDPKGYEEKLLRGRTLSAKEQGLLSTRLSKQGFVTKEKLEERREKEELRGCTFQPEVNDYAAFGSVQAKGEHKGDNKGDDESEEGQQVSVSSSDYSDSDGHHARRKEVDRCKELYRKGMQAKAREAELRDEHDRETRLKILRGRMASDHHFRRRVELDPSLAERFMKSLVV